LRYKGTCRKAFDCAARWCPDKRFLQLFQIEFMGAWGVVVATTRRFPGDARPLETPKRQLQTVA
ncbi:MAG: hypothetical protein ACKV2V_25820, partial [Blastocatellia bacterium]